MPSYEVNLTETLEHCLLIRNAKDEADAIRIATELRDDSTVTSCNELEAEVTLADFTDLGLNACHDDEGGASPWERDND